MSDLPGIQIFRYKDKNAIEVPTCAILSKSRDIKYGIGKG